MKYVPEVSVLAHSAIRIQGPRIVYVDPFHLTEEYHDADLICITHEHHDHLSQEDICRVARKETLYILPESCREEAEKAGLPRENIRWMKPGDRLELEGAAVEALPAYNVDKPFHPKERGWLGYVVEMLGRRYYIAGDTDDNEDVRKIRCHVALLPVGGTYTMTADEAAELARGIRPEVAIPTHYGDIVGSREEGEKFRELLEGSGIFCEI
ncbi:MAG: MBL fold metallo-hydrolase [Lachnospiraceae bacterium]|nr:MBL fold metallo-hydrolase [Lachnospiraceae bacterium]